MISNLTELLNEIGQTSSPLSAVQQAKLRFLGQIVSAVSRTRCLMSDELIACRGRKAGKQCLGDIAAWCAAGSELAPISWRCCECDEEGTIIDWQGTLYDEKAERQRRVEEYIQCGVWLNDNRLDEVELPLSKPPDADTGSKLRYPSGSVKVRKLSRGGLALSLPPLLLIELLRSGIVSMQAETITARIGHGATVRYRTPRIEYSQSPQAPVSLVLTPV